MKQKQIVMGVLTVLILIIIGLRLSGYQEQIPSPVVWVLVAAQFGVSYLWKPKTPCN